MTTWKLTAYAGKSAVQSALLAQDEIDDWDADIVVTGNEIAEDRPDDWVLEAFMPRKPSAADRKAVAGLFGGDKPRMKASRLPDEDWVLASQQGSEPIRAGRFHVHTPEHPVSSDQHITDLIIPTSQAFGTGQHATTAGCLAMLTRMHAEGVQVRNHADIGTGTGLLAFAAMDLWPRALALASDIDDVCETVVTANAALNGIALGGGPGELVMTIASGLDAPVIAARTPYDLVMANILAGPLVELAPDFARAVAPGGNLLLAGLLRTQESTVRRAMFRHGFRLARRTVRGDWSILWLRRRAAR